MKSHLLQAIPLLAFLYFACGINSKGTVAGTATDTENTLSGTVYNSDGETQEGVIVTLYSNSFQLAKRISDSASTINTPDLPFVTDTTDSNGTYLFTTIPTDLFSMRFYLSDRLRDSSNQGVFQLDNLDPSNEKGVSRQITLEKPAALKIKKGLLITTLSPTGQPSRTLNWSKYQLRDSYSNVFAVVESKYGILLSDLYPGQSYIELSPIDSLLELRAHELGISLWQKLSLNLISGDTIFIDTLQWEMPIEISSSLISSSSATCPYYIQDSCQIGMVWEIYYDEQQCIHGHCVINSGSFTDSTALSSNSVNEPIDSSTFSSSSAGSS